MVTLVNIVLKSKNSPDKQRDIGDVVASSDGYDSAEVLMVSSINS